MPKAAQDSQFKFPRSNRLASKQDFQSVFAHPAKISHKCFIALFIPNQQEIARLGIMLAKHRVKLAVDRNQLKRIIRQSFRYQQATLKGLDIIILMRSEWTSSDKLALRRDIDNIWQLIRP